MVHQPAKKGPPELRTAGLKDLEQGTLCLRTSPESRKIGPPHCHSSSTEEFPPPQQRHPHTTNRCAIGTTVAVADIMR